MIQSSFVTLSLAGQLLGISVGVAPTAIPVAQSAPQTATQQPQIQFDAARFDSITAVNLRALLIEAVSEGLPTGPLINRALEGAARKVHGSKILAVVRDHATAMMQARDALGEKTTAAELDAGASALRAGIDNASLAAVRTTRPVGQAVVPLTVLADIVSRGVPAKTARDAVTSIAKMPASDDALRGLQVTVAKNAIRGPGMAVDALNRYLKGTVLGANPPSAPATTDRKPIRPPAQ